VAGELPPLGNPKENRTPRSRQAAGPVRTFVTGGSDHPNQTALARRLQDYLRWRNANACHPDVVAAQRR